MKRLFRYFELSLGEQRGFILLSTVSLILLAVPIVHGFFQKEEELLTYDVMLLDRSDLDGNEIQSTTETTLIENKYDESRVTLHSFDPNGLSIEEWMSLGLSRQQARVIKNYEQKGGVFRRKEDLSKIYSISRRDYERLEPFIKVGDVSSSRRATDSSFQKRERKSQVNTYADLRVDISKSDSSELVMLKGIGPVLAARIIRFRESLGGFVKIEQIKEVYGLPEETYVAIRPHLIMMEVPIRKLKINLMTKADLARHPYISNKEAQWIVNYREQHGAFKNIGSLSHIEMLNREFLRKIEPYLDF